jgi:hypothetical protein
MHGEPCLGEDPGEAARARAATRAAPTGAPTVLKPVSEIPEVCQRLRAAAQASSMNVRMSAGFGRMSAR